MVKTNKSSTNYSRSSQVQTDIVTNKKKKKIKSEPGLQQKISKDSNVMSKTMEDYNEIFKRVSKYPHTSSLIRAGKDWSVNLDKENVDKEKPIPLSVRKHLHELAEKIYFEELKLYHQRSQDKHSGFDQTMRKNVIAHGTTKDKIAAYVLQCMDNPFFSLKDLNSLIELVSAKLKNQRIEAISNILNLFRNTFLPNGFVAKEFECHNFKDLIPFLKNNPDKVQKTLMYWYFEGQVRLAFLKFAENLDKVSHDIQEKTKLQGVKAIKNLAENHANQDSEIILRTLVNKLGDSNSKIAGDVKNCLSKLAASHISLKVSLVTLVEELLYRPNVNSRTQYYCLCFLEDILFNKKELELPERLCILYFDFFKNCSLKGKVNDKFMSAILRGLNRAYVFIKDKNLSFLEEQIDTFYTLTHKTNFNICTQVIQLIYSISGNVNAETSDRFYNILYEKILDNEFGQGSSTSAFLNLVFKAMCKDTNKNRFCAFTRRLLQVIEYKPCEIGGAVLFLISEALKDNPNITSQRSLGKCSFPSQTIEFRTQDGNQHDNAGNETFIVEEERSKVNLLASSSIRNKNSKFPNSKESKQLELKEESKLPSHQKNYVKTSKYLLNNRNPSYCGANLSPIWELSRVFHNFHPTVSLWASNLLSETEILYSGDPLVDFALFKSLERFALKNPKTRLPCDDHSKILGNRSYYIPKGARNIPVESDQFKKLDETKVPAEDMFFYNYYTIYRKQKVRKDNKEDDDDDDSSVDDDEFEDYLKRMNQAKSFGFESDDDEDLEFDFANKVADISVDDSDTANDSNSEVDADEFLGSDIDMEEDDVEDISFSEGSDEEENFTEFKKKRSNKGEKDDYGDLLMDADEFSNLLEEAGDADPYSGTSEAISNMDKSHSSQIQWEKKSGKEMSKLKHTNSKKTKRLVKPNKTNFTKNKNSKGKKK